MGNFLSINNILFTFWDYQMSYLEFFATLLNILAVWLVVRRKILTWPIGIVAVILFGILFYQIQLYSDMIEQIYFLGTGFYGWWLWLHLRKRKVVGPKKELKITHTNKKETFIFFSVIALGTALVWYFMSNIHLYFPRYFPMPASFPFLDAFTTVMSFTAQFLMAHKKIECWYLWILVDIIGIGLYYVKGVRFVALEYLIFLTLATKGYFNWKKEFRNYKKKEGG